MKDDSENKINEEIHDFFEKATPDIYDSIQKDCGKQKTAGKEAAPKGRNILKKVLAAAACLALLLAGTGIYFYETTFKTDASVYLDVNPGIRISLNRKEEVLDIVPTNEDGKLLMEDLTFKGRKLEDAVDTVVGRMLENGYLGDRANSILITVEGKSAEKSKALQTRVSDEIDRVMNREGLDAAVLSQSAAQDSEIAALEEEYGLSRGKAQLILEYTRADPQHTAGSLAGLTVNELNLLIQNSGTVMPETETHGQASEKNYIGFEKAVEIALSHFGKTEAEVQNLEKELETENGILVYDIEFRIGAAEYSADINAATGEIEASDADEEEPEEMVPQGKYIGKDRAEKIALAAADQEKHQTENLKTELETENGTAVYTVEFDTASAEFDILIDAQTGEILGTEKEPLDQEKEKETAPAASEMPYMDEARAKAAALSYAGLKEPEVKHLTARLESENDILVYSVEFETGTTEYEIELNAATGEILSAESEASEPEQEETPAQTAPGEDWISEEKAREIAFARAGVPSAEVRNVVCEPEEENGVAVYEVKFEAAGLEYSAEIRAEDGAVLDFEEDR